MQEADDVFEEQHIEANFSIIIPPARSFEDEQTVIKHPVQKAKKGRKIRKTKKSPKTEKKKTVHKIPKPRRNKNAFIIFSSELRPELKQYYPDLNPNQMMTELAERWKMLSSEAKMQYQELAKQDQERYQREREVFVKRHPDKFIGNKTGKTYKKRPPSGYAIFVKEMQEIIRKDPNKKFLMADVMRIVAGLWRKLCAEKIEHYRSLSKCKRGLKRRKNSIEIPNITVVCDPATNGRLYEDSHKPSNVYLSSHAMLEESKADAIPDDFEVPQQNNDVQIYSETSSRLADMDDRLIIDDYEYLLTAWKISKKKSVGYHAENAEDSFSDEDLNPYDFQPGKEGPDQHEVEEEEWQQ